MAPHAVSNKQVDFDQNIDMHKASVNPQDAYKVDARVKNHGFTTCKILNGSLHKCKLLEDTITNINMNLTSMSTLFSQYIAHYAFGCAKIGCESGRAMPSVTPPLVPTYMADSFGPSTT